MAVFPSDLGTTPTVEKNLDRCCPAIAQSRSRDPSVCIVLTIIVAATVSESSLRVK